MNIAYVLNLTTPNGGATKAFLNLLKGLMEKGVSPVVIVPDKQGVYTTLVEAGIKTYAITFRDNCLSHARTWKEKLLFVPRMVAKVIVNRKAADKLATILREEHIDILHSNSSVISIGFRATRKAGIPHLYHIREYRDLDFGKHYFPNEQSFARQLEQADSYSICITKDIQRHFHQEDNCRSSVIYDGVFEEVSQMPNHPKSDFFLYAGRIEPAKGLDTLLEAYFHYATKQTSKPTKLKVVGGYMDTPFVRAQQTYIKTHHLEEHVEILGERDDLPTLMSEAKAIIIPSRREGFGFCMPEAMHLGCLVIARNTGGTKEQLDNGLALAGQEIALRYETTEELTSLLSSVSEATENDFQTYKENAFKVVNQLYTLERSTEQVLQYYNDILHD
jgi:glycosyltransferase involved in cell wall biosynthesis